MTEIPKMRMYYKIAKVVLVVLDTSKGEYDLGLLKVTDVGDKIGEYETVQERVDIARVVVGKTMLFFGIAATP